MTRSHLSRRLAAAAIAGAIMWRVGPLGRPVAEARSEPVRDHKDSKWEIRYSRWKIGSK